MELRKLSQEAAIKAKVKNEALTLMKKTELEAISAAVATSEQAQSDAIAVATAEANAANAELRKAKLKVGVALNDYKKFEAASRRGTAEAARRRRRRLRPTACRVDLSELEGSCVRRRRDVVRRSSERPGAPSWPFWEGIPADDTEWKRQPNFFSAQSPDDIAKTGTRYLLLP